MDTVNKYMLSDLLNPLGGTADSDEKIIQFKDFNSNDEEAVKKIIIDEIKPHYDHMNDGYKTSVKRSLSYFLTTNRVDFGHVYDDCLIVFDHPADARDFFLWVWQVIFPGENYHLENAESFVEINDYREPSHFYS